MSPPPVVSQHINFAIAQVLGILPPDQNEYEALSEPQKDKVQELAQTTFQFMLDHGLLTAGSLCVDRAACKKFRGWDAGPAHDAAAEAVLSANTATTIEHWQEFCRRHGLTMEDGSVPPRPNCTPLERVVMTERRRFRDRHGAQTRKPKLISDKNTAVAASVSSEIIMIEDDGDTVEVVSPPTPVVKAAVAVPIPEEKPLMSDADADADDVYEGADMYDVPYSPEYVPMVEASETARAEEVPEIVFEQDEIPDTPAEETSEMVEVSEMPKGVPPYENVGIADMFKQDYTPVWQPPKRRRRNELDDLKAWSVNDAPTSASTRRTRRAL